MLMLYSLSQDDYDDVQGMNNDFPLPPPEIRYSSYTVSLKYYYNLFYFSDTQESTVSQMPSSVWGFS